MPIHKIAVIEDDPSIRSMYRFKLEQSGFQVKVAADGKQGLELVEAFRPELILLDIKMPIMNGDEMLARLRENEWASDTKVIVLTNISKDEAPMSLRFLSVDRYVVKAHTTPSQVVDVIEDVLR